MGRAVKDARLDKREARLKLAVQKEPYWRLISEGSHVGYYRGERVAKWVARHRLSGATGGYRKKTLGEADDTRDADGVDILNFRQADTAARKWFDGLALDREAAAAGPVHTVRSAIDKYIAGRDVRETARQGRSVNSNAHRLKLHVLGDAELSSTELSKLDTRTLKEWRNALPGTATSRQRTTNDFKAALNSVEPSATVRLVIKDGLAQKFDTAGATRDAAAELTSKLLTDAQTRQFLKALRDAGDDDLYRMCLVLAATGTRFAQAKRLKVRDVLVSEQRIMMPASYKGRAGPEERPPVSVPVGADVIEALMPAITGRKPGEPLLERWRHVQIGPMEWKRDRRGGWQRASEMTRPIRAAAAAAGLPASATSYSFRHSSIVRMLREGLPALLVAKLHDTSIKMIESNYARFIVDALADLARKAIMPMVEPERGDNVVSIGGR